MKNNIYSRSKNNGCSYECDCTGINIKTWERLMKGATRANQKEVTKIALIAGIIDEEQAKQEIKNPYFNPYKHYKTKTHIIYVHSCIEHFIKVY